MSLLKHFIFLFVVFFVLLDQCQSAPRRKNSSLEREGKLRDINDDDDVYTPDDEEDRDRDRDRESIGDIISRFWRSFRRLFRTGNLGNFLSNVSDQTKSLINSVTDRDIFEVKYGRRGTRRRDKDDGVDDDRD